MYLYIVKIQNLMKKLNFDQKPTKTDFGDPNPIRGIWDRAVRSGPSTDGPWILDTDNT